MEKLLSPTARMATGIQLAKDLYRDAKRFVALRKKVTGKYYMSTKLFYELFGDDGEDEADASSFTTPDSTYILNEGFRILTFQERTALYLKAVGYDTPPVVNDHLAVGMRQYRNILGYGRQKLKRLTGFREAYLAHQATAETGETIIDLLETSLLITAKVA